MKFTVTFDIDNEACQAQYDDRESDGEKPTVGYIHNEIVDCVSQVFGTVVAKYRSYADLGTEEERQ